MKRLIFVLIIMSGCCKTKEDKLREQLSIERSEAEIKALIQGGDSTKKIPDNLFKD